jgi:quinol monooxygenase YgiN
MFLRHQRVEPRRSDPGTSIHYGTTMDDNAVIVFASFRPIAGQEDRLHELLSWMVEHTRKEPGCERYDLYRLKGSGETLHIFERYRDDEALEAHRASDHYVEYRRQVSDLLQGPLEVLVLDGLDVAR